MPHALSHGLPQEGKNQGPAEVLVPGSPMPNLDSGLTLIEFLVLNRIRILAYSDLLVLVFFLPSFVRTQSQWFGFCGWSYSPFYTYRQLL